jgi:hypothetical protein
MGPDRGGSLVHLLGGLRADRVAGLAVVAEAAPRFPRRPTIVRVLYEGELVEERVCG